MSQINREAVEKQLADVTRQRDDAEAFAQRAADNLARLVSGLTPLAEVETEAVRSAANAYVSHVERFRLLSEQAAQLRRLLM